MSEVMYQYDGTLDGFLCCVYESYVYKEIPAAFCCDEDPLSLFEVRTVITQPAYSQRVSRGIASRSPKALAVVRRSFLTCLPDKELHIYAFIRKLLAEGAGFMRDLSDPVCYPLYKAIRHINGEVEKLRGFVRFSDRNGVLGAEIEPKNRVLPLIRMKYRKYPNLVKALENRHLMYNAELELIEKQEQRGELLVIRPDFPLSVKRAEKDPAKLTACYEVGRRVAEKELARLIRNFHR